MNRYVKHFIVDLLEGNGYLDLEELQKTTYDMNDLVDYVIDYFGEDELCIESLQMAVLNMAKEELIQEIAKFMQKNADMTEIIEKISEIGFDCDDLYELYANGLDNKFTLIVGDDETIEFIKTYLGNIIDEISKHIGFTSIELC